jgi:hypothetical protein
VTILLLCVRDRSRRTAAGGPRRACRRRHPPVVHDHRPAAGRQSAGVGQPVVHRVDRLPGERGGRAQLPVPAGPQHRPRRRVAGRGRAAPAPADHRGAAELPPGRHGVLERDRDLPRLRPRGRSRQLRRRAERRHRAGRRRAGAPGRAGRGRGGPRAAADARRGHHPDDGRARRGGRVRAAGPQPRAGARRPVRGGRARRAGARGPAQARRRRAGGGGRGTAA